MLHEVYLLAGMILSAFFLSLGIGHFTKALGIEDYNWIVMPVIGVMWGSLYTALIG